jgi:hypothetical protein
MADASRQMLNAYPLMEATVLNVSLNLLLSMEYVSI